MVVKFACFTWDSKSLLRQGNEEYKSYYRGLELVGNNEIVILQVILLIMPVNYTSIGVRWIQFMEINNPYKPTGWTSQERTACAQLTIASALKNSPAYQRGQIWLFVSWMLALSPNVRMRFFLIFRQPRLGLKRN